MKCIVDLFLGRIWTYCVTLLYPLKIKKRRRKKKKKKKNFIYLRNSRTTVGTKNFK